MSEIDQRHVPAGHVQSITAAPGGWIYEMARGLILVSDPAQWRQAETGTAQILAALSQLSKELKTMSQSISAEIDALTAKFQTDVDAITSQIADLHSQITTLQGELTAGSGVTQAQVDALSAIEAKASALATPVVVTPPDPTPAPTPAP
jgi:uncharacterized phage infection (PIP) family protein YhgE